MFAEKNEGKAGDWKELHLVTQTCRRWLAADGGPVESLPCFPALFVFRSKNLVTAEMTMDSFALRLQAELYCFRKKGRSKTLLSTREKQKSMLSSGSCNDTKQRSTSSRKGEGKYHTNSNTEIRQSLAETEKWGISIDKVYPWCSRIKGLRKRKAGQGEKSFHPLPWA